MTLLMQQVEEDVEDILILIPVVPQRPAGFDNRTFPVGDLRLPFGKEFKGGIGRKNPLEKKKCLLARKLIRERNRLGEGNMDLALRRKKSIEHLGVVL